MTLDEFKAVVKTDKCFVYISDERGPYYSNATEQLNKAKALFGDTVPTVHELKAADLAPEVLKEYNIEYSNILVVFDDAKIKGFIGLLFDEFTIQNLILTYMSM